MADPPQLPTGRVHVLHEMDFLASGASLRVTGDLEHLDLQQRRAWLNDRGAQLCVDVAEIDIGILREAKTLQFLGELVEEASSEGLPQRVLKARIARDVTGVDLALYERGLQVLRSFEAQHCPRTVTAG
mmetsp:Transcript_64348/g.119617  ORF Transcript_64348/g.119617 Transcript_64348/m.119617 type:complete len:129 (-) Transcript_64348:52-438(-)